MKRATARGAASLTFAALALVATGCGGSTPPPAGPPSWEIDLTGASSAGETPSAVRSPAQGRGEGTLPEDLDAVARELDASAVPKLRANQPAHGPANAPVTIQVWSDFECPYCARALPLLRELEDEFEGDVRVVWRALPLPRHALARETATAALEAHAQGGDAVFWQVHDGLFEAAADGLAEAEIIAVLRKAGVDEKRYRQALKTGTHDAAIAEDVAAADAIMVEGTPAFLVNRYYVYGIQPLEVMEHVVEKARDEAAP